MKLRDRTPPAPDPGPPKLIMDGALASLLLATFGFFVRGVLTPDGVPYLENAELFARGQFTDAIQGYWSPGYSLMLAPAAWAASGDRALLLLIAHVVQTGLGLAALWLAIIAIRRRVPAHAQRVVFWGCAWVILRWLTPEFLTPDLLLCVLLLCFVIRLPAHGARDEAWLGVIAGAGFLVKTSIWPWLAVAVTIVVARSARSRDWRTFPVITAAVGGAIATVLIAILSVRAGHVTLGSVGALNARWYLGDLTRRTPDTDSGPHATRRSITLASGAVVVFNDLRPTSRTYAPWSDPERWAGGVPSSAVPSLSLDQITLSWRQNAGEFLRWIFPLGLGIGLILAWSTGLHGRASARDFLHLPVLWVGIAAVSVFLVVHAEHRLLAPAALLLLLGAWREPASARPRAHFRWLAIALIAGIGVHLAVYLPSTTRLVQARTASEQPFHEFFSRTRALNPSRDVVLVGPFGMWVGILWRNDLRVAAQFGALGEQALNALPDAERPNWLRAQFGDSILGVATTMVRRDGNVARMRLEFSPF